MLLMRTLQTHGCTRRIIFPAYPSTTCPRPLASTLLLIVRSIASYNDASMQHTIYAPATPPGKSAIAIIRISGPGVRDVWKSKIRSRPMRSDNRGMAVPDPKDKREGRTEEGWPPPSRKALVRRIVHAQNAEILDEAIVVYFPASSSLTAQPLLELHLHGSIAVLKSVLSSLSTISGLKPAEPGEFTRLAFDSGRMDLTEVEGLRDLIDSETEAQRKVAIWQAAGAMRAIYDSMRGDIISAQSVLEALIDFGEDEQIESKAYEFAIDRIIQLRTKITSYFKQGKRGEILRDGIRLAIFGAPNAGKSSLINWLAQREASIVTSHPGTTRDVVELSLDFHGYPLIISDTAGLRDTLDEVEAIGVDRAKDAVKQAHIKLCMVSLPEATDEVRNGNPLLDPLTASLVDDATIFVLNKTDIQPTQNSRGGISRSLEALLRQRGPQNVLSISVKESQGLEHLSATLRRILEKEFDANILGEGLLITQERHRNHLQECLRCLDAFLAMESSANFDLVIAAEELRYASQSLAKVTGAVHVEDILDELFASFCIGK